MTEEKNIKKEKEPIETIVNIPPLSTGPMEHEEFIKPVKSKGLSKFKMVLLTFIFLSLFLFIAIGFISCLNVGLGYKIIALIFMFMFSFDLLHSFKFFFR